MAYIYRKELTDDLVHDFGVERLLKIYFLSSLVLCYAAY